METQMQMQIPMFNGQVVAAMEAQMQMKIPMFNGEDHEIWSTKMRTLFMARDLWDVVETGSSDEFAENSNQSMEELAKRQKDLRIKDMTALHMLHMSVTDSIFYRIGRATSSKQAWELLKADFGETEEIQARKSRNLVEKLMEMKMTNEENFDDFIDKSMEFVDRSRFYGSGVTDDFVIDKILESLLSSRFTKTVFHIRGRESRDQKLTINEALYILRKAECNNRSQKPEEASHNQKSFKCYSNNKRGRGQRAFLTNALYVLLSIIEELSKKFCFGF